MATLLGRPFFSQRPVQEVSGVGWLVGIFTSPSDNPCTPSFKFRVASNSCRGIRAPIAPDGSLESEFCLIAVLLESVLRLRLYPATAAEALQVPGRGPSSG